MQMKIDELESLIVAYPKRKQHEHNSDLKMDSEKDKFVREKVDQDRTEIINEQTASNKTKLKNLQVHCKSVTNEVTEQLSFSELSLEKTKVSNIYLIKLKMLSITKLFYLHSNLRQFFCWRQLNRI